MWLIATLIGKNVYYKPRENSPVNKPYRKMEIDKKQPIIEKLETLNYKEILKEADASGKPIPPINRHNKKTKVPTEIKCPKCGAPHNYLYNNNGNRGQYKCKICSTTFHRKNRYKKKAIIRCPYCARALEKKKSRKIFDIYKCTNSKCTFYLDNLNNLTKSQKKEFKNHPENFKLHYIYRVFTMNFIPMSKENKELPTVDLSRIYSTPHTLGLILTYHVNYGISARKTASLMDDVHGVKISHQTIINYCNAVGQLVKPFIDNYNYDLSNQFCGDETYIKVNGKWHYIFYFFDAVKKVILSYHVSEFRDTQGAIIALDDTISKIKNLPKKLEFIVDGNPIYILAQHFFAAHGINFTIKPVIGLTNEDPVSKAYRPLKQIIERLNRTFKAKYRSKHGFHSANGSVSFVNLFVAYFNFLRPHSKLNGQVPVEIKELEKLPHMPAKWAKIIELSQNTLINLQSKSA